MRALMSLGLALVFLLPAPAASAAFKGCYERIYDKRYLRKNRKQDVVKIRLQIGVAENEDAPFELQDRIDAGFRKSPRYRGGQIQCNPKGDELDCEIIPDGGGFIITERGEDSVRITNTSSMRFGDEEDGIGIRGRGQNREFRLFRVSEGACP
jgi:hypothetical protein